MFSRSVGYSGQLLSRFSCMAKSKPSPTGSYCERESPELMILACIRLLSKLLSRLLLIYRLMLSCSHWSLFSSSSRKSSGTESRPVRSRTYSFKTSCSTICPSFYLKMFICSGSMPCSLVSMASNSRIFRRSFGYIYWSGILASSYFDCIIWLALSLLIAEAD